MVNFKTPRVLTPVLDYVQLVNPERIEITGYRGATRLANGRVLTEHEGIGEARAKEIADMLRGAGADRAQYRISSNPRPALGGPDNRRTTIRVIP